DRQGLELPPLVVMNPMGKDHLPAYLDALLAFDADTVGANAAAGASTCLREAEGDYKLGLVVADDVAGGWTNRYTTEYGFHFGMARPHGSGWLISILWASDPPSPERTREEVLSVLHRVAYTQQHGTARNLQERMTQEGIVMALAGCTEP